MPGHDGYALCRTARSEHPGVRVLLMVGTFEPFDSAAASAAGADAVLRKPFMPDELQRKVEELLGPMAAPRPGPVSSPEEVAARPVSASSPPPAASAAAGAGEPGQALSDDDVERIARRVLALGGEEVLERVARELLGKAAASERVPPAAGRGALDGDPERE
jgi:DNA-binding response OmpR family regulator